MSITYPAQLPTASGIATIELRASNAVVVSKSPFTGVQQALAYPRQEWSATVTLPPLKRANAESWIAFLIAQRGGYGTFLMGDPLGATPRGVATGTPVVASGSTGGSVNISGASVSVTGWLKAGDYVQLGSGSTATLHKVLVDVDTAADGTATLEVWPFQRRTLTVGETVTLNDTVGNFRLSAGDTAWSASEGVKYGISFDCMEAI